MTITFTGYLRISTFLIALSAFLSLILTGEMGPAYISVMAMGGVMFLVQERVDLSLLSRSVTLLSIPFLPLDYFVISKDLLLAFSHFLILLTAARVCRVRSSGEYNQFFILSFFILLASSAMTTNFYFALTFVVYLISVTWAMLLLHLKEETERRFHERSIQALEGTMTFPFFIGIGWIAVLSLLSTLVIFFILPRMGVGMFSRKSEKVIQTTGFSDVVELGKSDPVTPDQTVIMRVELPGHKKNPGFLYLKGSVLESFNGTSWEKGGKDRVELPRMGEDFLVARGFPEDLQQDIILDPMDTRVLFGATRVVRISGRFISLYRDQYGIVHLPMNPSARFQYTVYSDTRTPSVSQMESDNGEYQDDIIDLYTRLPQVSVEITDLARSLTRGVNGNYERVKAIEGFLKSNFKATLSPARDASLPPVDDFLFKSQEGYCNHFSTAMIVLLRASGVPSRLVTGYRADEWNDLGQFYTVRQKNAHSWVEVLFPSYGWVRFDPTPTSSEPSGNVMGVKTFSGYISYLRLKWDRYIINFTIHDQVKAAKEVRKRSRAGMEAFSDLSSSLKARKIIWPFAIAGLSAVVLGLGAMVLRRRRKRRVQTGSTVTIDFYREMLSILEKKGIKRPAGMTAREFARNLEAKGGIPESGVERITELFEDVRYGGVSLDERQARQIRTDIDGIRRYKPD